MFLTTAEQLKLQGIDCQKASQITFQNKLFTKSLDFSINARQSAMKFCQKYLDAGVLCLLVEHSLYLTVWLEDEEEKLTDKSRKSQITVVKQEFTISSFENEKSNDNIVPSNINSISPISEIKSQYELNNLPINEENTEENPSEIKYKSNAEKKSSSDSSLNDQESHKKRRSRTYRGISY
jgi:hypothetical protein